MSNYQADYNLPNETEYTNNLTCDKVDVKARTSDANIGHSCFDIYLITHSMVYMLHKFKTF